MDETIIKKTGREPIKINWPDVPFTVNEVEQLLVSQGVKISKAGVQARIATGLRNGTIVFKEKRASLRGAPTKVYQLAENA